MKRKNDSIRALRRQGISDWMGYTRRVQRDLANAQACGGDRESAPIHPTRSVNEQRNKDMPAFVAGGGAGCVRHRKAKTFARTMGRSMRRRR